MKTFIRYITVIFPLLSVLNILIICNHSYAENNVRVGFIDDQFIKTDESGRLYGYGVDYLKKISELTEIDFEYVQAENTDEIFKMLENNEIDMYFPSIYTDISGDERFMEGNVSVCEIYGAVFALNSRGDLFYEDYDTFSNITFGVVEGTIYEKQFEDYAAVHGFTPHIIKFAGFPELAEALENCSIDAAVNNIIRAGENTKMIGMLDGMECFCVYRSDDYMLSKTIDTVIYEINVMLPDFRYSLTEKYFPLCVEFPLSKEEIKFINSAGTITVACPCNMRPISYKDRKGNIVGMSPAVIREISKISGLKFNIVELPEGNVSHQYLTENNIDLISCVGYNDDSFYTQNLNVSIPYMDTKAIFVCRPGELLDANKPMRLAVMEGYTALPLLMKKLYPKFRLLYYHNMDEAMEAIKNHDADLLINSQYIVEYYLAKAKYNNLSVVPFETIESSVCLAAVSGAQTENASVVNDPRFIPVMNKIIRNLDKDVTSTIFSVYSYPTAYEYTFEDYIHTYKAYIVTAAAIIVFALIFVAAAIRLKHRCDTTEQRHRKRLDCIVNALDGIICIIIPEDRCVEHINNNIINVLNITEKDLEGYSKGDYMEFIHPDDREIIKYVFTPENIMDKHFSVKFRLIPSTGECIPMIMRCCSEVRKDNKHEIYAVMTKYL